MSRRVPARYFVVPMLAIASSTAWGVDRQIGVDASLKVGYSQLTGGAPSPWGWRKASPSVSGSAVPVLHKGVGSNNIATMEYQLPEVQPTRIRSAIFQFSGRAIQCRRRTGRGRRLRVSGRRKEGRHRFDRRHARRDAVGRLRTTRRSTSRSMSHTSCVSCRCRQACATWVSTCARATTDAALLRRVSRQAQHRRCRSGRRRGTGPGRSAAVNIAGLAGGSQVDVNRVIGGLVGAAGTLLGGGGSKPARDQAGNEAAAVLEQSADDVNGPRRCAGIDGSRRGSSGRRRRAAAASTAGVLGSAPGAAPVNVDIVGIKLGMTLDEVKRAVRIRPECR